ncbi:MAG: dockerin type I repeat-containing protein, partial [Verrucomicrobiota bacterium]|nr:dockerin type I repeat-containing protein [Verrucomicrobiota bacterium]
DPTGAAVIAFADDHNDIKAHTYVTRQISGPGVNNSAVIPTPVEGAALPARAYEPLPTAASVGGIPGSQVTDFRDDVRTGGNPQTGGTVVLPNDDPTDILSILYSTEGTPAAPILSCTMKVSDLTAIPPSTNWRMNFAANTLNPVLSPTGEFTFAVSDRGDQFFVRASTDASGAQTFIYGRAVRNFDGSLTYNDIGAADAGAFDQVNKTITVKVAVSKLNAALPAGHTALGIGSVLAGLRGSAFTTAQGSGSNRADDTRGGTQYPISFPVQLASAASVKTHAAAGAFAIDLPLAGNPGIECRSGGASGDYTVVFTFPNAVSSVTGASVTAGTGKVTNGAIGSDPHQYVVNLTGVTTAQVLTVSLHNVSDTTGLFSSLVSVQMRVVVGDTNADGIANAADTTQTRNGSGQLVGPGNFRLDVNTDGTVNSADATLVRNQSGS